MNSATPPALRWVAVFLALCGVLGLWLGFRDQIRRNPPAWYTGTREPVAVGPVTPDIAREAVPFDPDAPRPPPPGTDDAAPAVKPPVEKPVEKPVEAPELQTPADDAAPAPRAVTTPAAPRPRPVTPPPARSEPEPDPVGDILEGQKAAEPAPVPY